MFFVVVLAKVNDSMLVGFFNFTFMKARERFLGCPSLLLLLLPLVFLCGPLAGVFFLLGKYNATECIGFRVTMFSSSSASFPFFYVSF